MKCMTLFRNAQCQGTSSLGVGRIVCTKGLKPCETDPSRESMKKRTCQWSHYFICLCSPYEINWKMRGLFRWWWWISDRIFVNWHCFIHAPPVMTDFPRECSYHDLHRCCRRTQWIKEKLETNKRMEGIQQPTVLRIFTALSLLRLGFGCSSGDRGLYSAGSDVRKKGAVRSLRMAAALSLQRLYCLPPWSPPRAQPSAPLPQCGTLFGSEMYTV